MNTSLKIAASVTVLVGGVGSRASDTPPPRLLDRLETQMRLPPYASSVKSYTRIYTYDERKRFVDGLLTLGGPKTRTVASIGQLKPTPLDGGCSVISIRYDIRARSFVVARCNGSA